MLTRCGLVTTLGDSGVIPAGSSASGLLLLDAGTVYGWIGCAAGVGAWVVDEGTDCGMVEGMSCCFISDISTSLGWAIPDSPANLGSTAMGAGCCGSEGSYLTGVGADSVCGSDGSYLSGADAGSVCGCDGSYVTAAGSV